MFVRRLEDVKPYVTKDESLIREFFHPLYDTSGMIPRNVPVSLALATVNPGKRTLRHVHETSTELYYIIKGVGTIELGSKTESLEENTLVYIPPKTDHRVTNTDKEDLLILCVSNPPYRHEDTRLLE
jgi:mannose-6-phosphate isomerase-like protein (cupin superfamily)